jgi:hypothetical protein
MPPPRAEAAFEGRKVNEAIAIKAIIALRNMDTPAIPILVFFLFSYPDRWPTILSADSLGTKNEFSIDRLCGANLTARLTSARCRALCDGVRRLLDR